MASVLGGWLDSDRDGVADDPKIVAALQLARPRGRRRAAWWLASLALLPRRKACGPELCEEVARFLADNAVDDEAKQALMSLPPPRQGLVLAKGPLEGRNPSAMLIARVCAARGAARAQGQESWGGAPTQGTRGGREARGGRGTRRRERRRPY